MAAPPPPPPPARTPDPFDILGVPAKFDISAQEVRAAYLGRSRTLHPDVALDEADEEAAALNHAKQVIQNPEARAEALLARLGGPSKERDRSLPPSFLQQMLEVREQIETAMASGSPEQRAEWERWAEQERSSHIQKVSELFRAHQEGGTAGGMAGGTAGGTGSGKGTKEGGSEIPEVLCLIRTELNMWRYVERLIEQLTDLPPTAHL